MMIQYLKTPESKNNVKKVKIKFKDEKNIITSIVLKLCNNSFIHCFLYLFAFFFHLEFFGNLIQNDCLEKNITINPSCENLQANTSF